MRTYSGLGQLIRREPAVAVLPSHCTQAWERSPMNSERLLGTLRSIGSFVFSRYALRFRRRERLEAWQARRLRHFMAKVLPRGQRFNGLTQDACTACRSWTKPP